MRLYVFATTMWLAGCTADPNNLDQDGDGFVASEECDDFDAAVNPDAAESCNGRDDNCDGTVDNDAGPTWFVDADQDAWGAGEPVRACAQPAGHVTVGGDCDDADAAYHPGAAEADCADPNDYNCDGSVGFADADGDGFAACKECDDTAKAVNPDATETCNDLDDNCNGVVDLDAANAPIWYADVDGDGVGGARLTVQACDAPAGYVASNEDCDDLDAKVYPKAAEICDGKDSDCDAVVPPVEADADKDGFLACEECNDKDRAVFPGAAEACNKVDDDCDGSVDESAVDARTWYTDKDGDLYGDDASAVRSCEAGKGQVARGSDCNDADKLVNPGADEVCGGGDEDCDGRVDEASAIDAKVWYLDDDGDTWGTAATSTRACVAPTKYVASFTDCNDKDKAIYPGAPERCATVGVDDDCDGSKDEADASDTKTWYLDADADTFGGKISTKACTAPTGYVSSSTDCADTDPRAYPGGTETCGGGDEDCDGSTDESGAVGEKTWYADLDDDGYGVSTSTVKACALPKGYTDLGGDCDDAEDTTYPGSDDVCDGVDNDCSGVEDDDDAFWGSDATCPAASCLEILTARGKASDGVYWVDPLGGSAFQVYCDMTTDGGGWTLMHKTNKANANDRTDAGYNKAALSKVAVDDVASLSRKEIAAIGTTFRVTSTDGKKMFYADFPYYFIDSHPPSSPVRAKLKWTDPWKTGSVQLNSAHGICAGVDPSSGGSFVSEHFCSQRYCCGSPNNGLWFNGGSWSGNYYSGAAWVR